MRISEAPDPHANARRRGGRGVTITASKRIGVALLLAGARCLMATSLSGRVMDESFHSLAKVRVNLLLERKQEPQWSVFTDEEGVFTFPDVAPGEYTVRVNFIAFLSAEIHNIHVNEAEDHHLRRILLEAGEGYGNCVVRINPMTEVRHTGDKDLAISGHVLIGRGETADVTLVVFAEEKARTRSTISDNK